MNAYAAEEVAQQAAEAAAQGGGHEGLQHMANWITLAADYSDHPIIGFLQKWEIVVFSLTAGLILLCIGRAGARKRTLVPGNLQNCVEVAVEGLDGIVSGILGEKGREHLPFLGTLFLYIWLQNMFGMIPGMMAPTSNLNTTVALAVCVFFYVQYTCFKENGFLGYFHHLMGSPTDTVGWLMVPLNLPLHILEEFIKPLSLSLRLFGNIFGEDALIATFAILGIGALSFMHSPVGLPLQFPFMLLSLLLGTIQALVFTLLSTIYISMTLPHDHGHSKHKQAHAH